MSLTKDFNHLAGKIVSGAELKTLLKQAGFDPNISAPESLLGKKISEGALVSELGSDMYLTSRAVTGIEEQALNCEDKDVAMSVLGIGLQVWTHDIYMNILPAVQSLAWTSGNKKLVDAFIKAAEDCTDHKNSVGADLHEMQQVISNITAKIEKKFGL